MSRDLFHYLKVFNIDPKVVEEIDLRIKQFLPNGIISEGCQYARWVTIEGGIVSYQASEHLKPDKVFIGEVFGKLLVIYMFIPFFS